MKVITQTEELRSIVATILARRSGRRVAVVAFVGGDVLRFVPEPDGLEVYCWPNKLATNPDGVRALLNNGAKVYFVPRLHMKIYWSSRGGCLIGSPNLSANALDETVAGLHEIGWFSKDTTLVDIDALIRRLHAAGAILVDEAILTEFEREYAPSTAGSVNRRVATGPPFDAYLNATLPKRFSCVSWVSLDENTRAEAAAAHDYVEEATGQAPRSKDVIVDSMLVRHGAKAGSWLLACKIKSDETLGKVNWIYAHLIVKARSNALRSTALQLRGLHVPEPPFDITSNGFQGRLAKYAALKLATEFDEGFNLRAFKQFERGR